MSEGFGMGKTAFVFAVIFGCFAVLYPRIFHPMLKSVLGIYTKPSHRSEESGSPQLKKLPHSERQSDPYKESIERTVQSLKAGPHPGMRADVNKRGDGGTKTTMAMSVLPIYTVGLVVFLVYTLTKILFKKPSASDMAREQLKNIHYSSAGKKFIFGDDFEGDDDFREYLRKKEQNPLKTDPRKITEFELNQLQQRLQETEQAMERIVSQMSNVNQKISSSVPSVISKRIKSKIIPENEEADTEKDILTVEINEKQDEEVSKLDINSCETECETVGIISKEESDNSDRDTELVQNTNSIEESSTENVNKEDFQNHEDETCQVRKRILKETQ